MIGQFIMVALGGAVGACLRFATGLAVVRAGFTGFPVAVLGANVIGSLLMGIAVVWLDAKGLRDWQPFVMAGLLGGFTTFSAFSLEAYTLFQRGDAGLAALYIILSVVLSISALVAGVALAKGALA